MSKFATTQAKLSIVKDYATMPGGYLVDNPDLTPIQPDDSGTWDLIHVNIDPIGAGRNGHRSENPGRIYWTWKQLEKIS